MWCLCSNMSYKGNSCGERRMNWKGFLKPDKRKIVVLIIILLFISLDILFGHITGIIGDILLKIPFFTLFCPSFGISSIFCLIQNIIAIIIIPIYWYLLSCLIVWIYDKIRKGKKK